MRLRKRELFAAAVLAVATLMVAVASPLRAEPLKIRMAWVVTPPSLIPLLAKLPPSVMTHMGKSYTIEDTHIGASSQQITAITAGQIDIAGLNYSSLPQGRTISTEQEACSTTWVAQEPSNTLPMSCAREGMTMTSVPCSSA